MLRNPKFILSLLGWLLVISCRDKWVDNSSYDKFDGKFVTEIPIIKQGRNKGQFDYFYRWTRLEAHELQLDSLETGFETVQIRVWLGHSLAIKHHLVILKLIDRFWHAELVTYENTNDYGQKQIKWHTKRKEISPNKGWKNLIDNLHRLDIMNLPNSDDLTDYHHFDADGIDYFFEIATRNKYRFYFFDNPKENSSKFWQAQNVLTFSKLLEEEFDFKYTK